MIAWSTIVCALDFSRAARTALEHAAELARRFHADLVLAHVWRAPGGDDTAGALALGADEEAELERKLEDWERAAEQIAGREVRTVLATGSPAVEIARIASEERADLVVVGTHGRTGFERAVLGSVAADIARDAPCAVLVVKAAEEAGD